MRMAILIVGIVCVVLSTCVVGVSASLPIVNGPRTSWSEAMMGIIPGAICGVLSLVIAVVGLILVLMAPKREPTRKSRRGDDESDLNDDA